MQSARIAERLCSACPAPTTFTLRTQGEGDLVFLRQLFVSRRWAEACAMPGWDDQQRLAFLHSQADLQQRHYSQHYSGAAFLIIEVQGQAIGRLCINADGDNLRLVDIALLGQWQRRGIGATLLCSLAALADESGASVALSVDSFSPARRLYERHGFLALPGEGLSLQMHRPANPLRERAPMTG